MQTLHTPAANPPLRRVDSLLAHYGESHRNPTNELIHFAAIPLIMWSIVGLLFALHPWVAYAFLAASLVYYLRLGSPLMVLCMVLWTALTLALVLAAGSLLVPLAVLGASAGLLTWWLGGMPPEQATLWMGLIGSGAILSVIVLFLVAGALRRVNVYDAFVDGAKEGFGVAVGIIPYLVAMLAAIAVFRAAGLMDVLMGGIAWVVAALGWPTDFLPAVPVGLMKVLSGSGARGLMVDVMQTYGVASFPARLAAIIQGSTETTFYVLAVYFGSVGVKHTRHALPCALLADAVGLVAAVAVAYAFFR